MPTVGKTRTLRIGWLIFAPVRGSGGYHNIIRIANLLASFGHENVFFMDHRTLGGEDAQQPECYIRRHFGPTFATVQPWPQVVEQVDVALATQWDTFDLLERCAPAVTRAYFVQDFEPFFYPMGYSYLKSEQTYRAGVPCITLGHWLGTFLRETYGATTFPFDFSVEHHRYFPRPESRPGRPRVIFYARPSTPRRCFELGIAALAQVHARHPEAEIVVFGDHDLRNHNIPFPVVDRGILDHEELAELYASATVGLVLSTTNPSLMPPELMAAGCAVVDLDLPANHFLIKHEVTGLLAAPEPGAVAGAVCRLLEDRALREHLVANAAEHVRPLSWEHSARQVEAALLELVPESTRMPTPPRVDVEHITGEGLTPALSPALLVGQRYIGRHDGLSGIAVAAGETGAEVPVLRVYEGTTAEQLLVEARASGADGAWIHFDFPPLPAVRHRPLYFTLASSAGPRLCFDYQATGGGSLAYNHVPQPGQLLFRTFYRPAEPATAREDLLEDELEYLRARQALAAEEQRLLSAYLEHMQHTVQNGNWRQRLARAGMLARRGEITGLVREARHYLQWATGQPGRK